MHGVVSFHINDGDNNIIKMYYSLNLKYEITCYRTTYDMLQCNDWSTIGGSGRQ